VPAILADNPHHAIPADNLAVAADSLYGSTHFHIHTSFSLTAGAAR
jgi:hypothetical protein